MILISKSQIILLVTLFTLGVYSAASPYMSGDYFGGHALANTEDSGTDKNTDKDTPVTPQKPPFQATLLAAEPIEAQAVYIFDIQENTVLYAKNEGVTLPLASLTKMMTAITANELALSTTTTVTISQKSLTEEGDSGLYWLEKWSLSDLIDFSLITSSNDGAAAIAEALGTASTSFVSAMNTKATSLGLTSTTFYNPTGLDLTATSSGAYGTARDIGTLFTYAYKHHPELLEATRKPTASFSSLSGFSHTAKNTNKIVGQIPFLIGSKTGFTDLAGGNLAVVFDAGIDHPITVVVMGSSVDGRFKDMVTLTKAVTEYIAKH